jgi:hypothetical protein
MAWLDWAIPDPAPDGLGGYPALNVPLEVAPELRYGVIWHSAAGVWRPPAYKPSDLMRSRGVSWGATVMLNGDVWRHRPRPTFVNYHGGGPAQNIGLDGFEVEGTGPWTVAQKVSILRVTVETWKYMGWQPIVLGFQTDRTQEAVRAAILGRGRGSLWFHTWVSATSCPGGRNDYPWLMAGLAEALVGEEDDMPTTKEIVDALRPVIKAEVQAERKQTRMYLRSLSRYLRTGTVGLLNGPTGNPDDARFPNSKERDKNIDDVLAAIAHILAGGGATPDEIIDRVKERL